MSAHGFGLRLFRISAAALLLFLGGLGVYGFGAGYFSTMTVGSIRLGLPTPWNVLAVVLLAATLLAAVRRIFVPPSRRSRH